jgi:hypothetical protein
MHLLNSSTGKLIKGIEQIEVSRVITLKCGIVDVLKLYFRLRLAHSWARNGIFTDTVIKLKDTKNRNINTPHSVIDDSNKNIAMKNVRPCKGAEVMFGERFIFLISLPPESCPLQIRPPIKLRACHAG